MTADAARHPAKQGGRVGSSPVSASTAVESDEELAARFERDALPLDILFSGARRMTCSRLRPLIDQRAWGPKHHSDKFGEGGPDPDLQHLTGLTAVSTGRQLTRTSEQVRCSQIRWLLRGHRRSVIRLPARDDNPRREADAAPRRSADVRRPRHPRRTALTSASTTTVLEPSGGDARRRASRY
jgi:hypothetical protein